MGDRRLTRLPDGIEWCLLAWTEWISVGSAVTSSSVWQTARSTQDRLLRRADFPSIPTVASSLSDSQQLTPASGTSQSGETRDLPRNRVKVLSPVLSRVRSCAEPRLLTPPFCAQDPYGSFDDFAIPSVRAYIESLLTFMCCSQIVPLTLAAAPVTARLA
jgi:hypothetical protein